MWKGNKKGKVFHFWDNIEIPSTPLHCAGVDKRDLKTGNIHQSVYEELYCSLGLILPCSFPQVQKADEWLLFFQTWIEI